MLYHWARILPLAQTTLFSAFFSTNIYFWIVSGYFQPNSSGNPLLHLWTLGVEEQFYIVIPVLLLLLWKVSRAAVKPLLFLGLLLSLAACIFLGSKDNATTAFFMLPTRAWELLAGALIAGLPESGKSLRAALCSFLGLALILFSFMCLDTANTFSHAGTSVEVSVPFLQTWGIYPFPGYMTIPVVLGSVLLLRYGNCGPLAGMLCSRPFVGIGKISYSLYLWHWPIIVFTRYVCYDKVSPLGLTVVFVVSLFVSYLSWRWLEMPVRKSKGFTPPVAFAFTGFGCAFLWCVCLFLVYTEGLRSVLHVDANKYASAPEPLWNYTEKFAGKPKFHPPAYPPSEGGDIKLLGDRTQKPSFFLVGDSHAWALSYGLDRVAAENHRSGYYIKVRIPAFREAKASGENVKVMNWVADWPDIQDVYLVGRWSNQFLMAQGLPQFGEKGKVQPVVPDPESQKQIEDDFRNTAVWLRQHGKNVYVFTPVPDYGYEPADLMARSRMFPLATPLDMTRQDYLNRHTPILLVLDKLQKEGLITEVPQGEALLSGDHSVFMAPDGTPYYRDADHLSPDGAYVVSHAIAPVLWSDSQNK